MEPSRCSIVPGEQRRCPERPEAFAQFDFLPSLDLGNQIVDPLGSTSCLAGFTLFSPIYLIDKICRSVIVRHFSAIRRLSLPIKVPRRRSELRLWPAAPRVVQPKWESPGRLRHGVLLEKAKARRGCGSNNRDLRNSSRPAKGRHYDASPDNGPRSAKAFFG